MGVLETLRIVQSGSLWFSSVEVSALVHGMPAETKEYEVEIVGRGDTRRESLCLLKRKLAGIACSFQALAEGIEVKE